ncbi:MULTISPECIES: hypothetical protein [Cysteiniphilum]|uniref:Uncharacterized protein n=1 Tax=Cysteiniphilum litorale TaxID=2056700 RepID=A0A8J3E958_9GAMM|nr:MULTISPECIES: hypothetical protein [Cysteiniphilum]GGG04765.1 hypothetical protein GCM10010995_22750 [Cysteiniphilum litorale]
MRSLITNQPDNDAWFDFFNYVRAVEKDQVASADKKTPKRLQEIKNMKNMKNMKNNHEQAVHVVNAVLAINHVTRG